MSLKIQIACATTDGAFLYDHVVATGTSIRDAILQSGILETFPEIDLQHNQVGIYGKTVELDTLVNEGDRIEIYRPLLMDPKQSRRRRARDMDQKKT